MCILVGGPGTRSELVHVRAETPVSISVKFGEKVLNVSEVKTKERNV